MEVILYHKENCPQCRALEQVLNRNHIEYEATYDFSYVSQKCPDLRTAPILQVDDKFLTGVDAWKWANSQR